MSAILYINGEQADLAPDTVIAQTRQVNDLNSIDNRQASYTNKFSLPKTAQNIRIMRFLTIAGNSSPIPYQKNECSLYSTTGECFVYNGWAVITDGGNSFDVVIYDGIIDLYKDIENKTLSSLGLTDISHEKTFQNIKQSWDQNKPYTYILADYNGDTSVNQPAASGITVNLDYLVPSVKVSYLWDAIFSGRFIAEGSIFDHPDFNNLWMTFPKGVPNLTEQNTIVYQGSGAGFDPTGFVPSARFIARYQMNSAASNPGAAQIVNQNHLKVTETASYRLDIQGIIRCRRYPYGTNTEGIPESARVFIAKNVNGMALNAITAWQEIIIAQYGVPFTESKQLSLSENDTIAILVVSPNAAETNYYMEQAATSLGNIKLTKLAPSVINFSEAFTDFSIRDFITEIIQRFGLTLYKDKYSNVYRFLTLQEVLQTNQVKDWSDKYIKKNQEDYIYGAYTQRNWFRYAYNDKEQSHHDGYLSVINANLPDASDAFKSKIYCPERQKVNFMNRETNVYKLWEKEVVENPQNGQPPVKYKTLDKRYYLLRAESKNTGITLQSNANPVSNGYCTNYYAEQYTDLPFQDIITRYYAPLTTLLENSLIIQAQFWLNEADIAGFDFAKKYHVAQLGGNFIINKIINYIPGKPTVCEMVRVS